MASNLVAPSQTTNSASGTAPAPQPISITIAPAGNGAELAPQFLGLSYETSALLPTDGRYYFDPTDKALLNTFKTLGIKSLRVGGNAVDDPTQQIPQEKDIDMFFSFARAAGVKVIYTFRLKNGNPADSARLAGYIAAHDADTLDSFCIGNEPNFYNNKNYDEYFAKWKPHYDAILQAVPNAMFDGPSVGFGPKWVLNLAAAIFPDKHLAMASDHHYFLGSGRAAEKDPVATRARFLSNSLHEEYKKAYEQVGGVLAAQSVPYRIDEANSCYNGGAKDASDTYASTLWALDCTNWWAAHHILGMNFHTGDSVGRDKTFGAANYAAFVHQPDYQGFEIRPQAYAYLAFTQSAHGQSLGVTTDTPPQFNFNAYAYQDHDASIYLTLINKNYGDQAQPATVSIHLPPSTGSGKWERMDLTEKDQDVAAKTGIQLGGASIDSQGNWSGQWHKTEGATSGDATFQVPPASATLLHFSPAK
jgi:hypothetical protein